MSRTAFVTGGTGFIGLNLVELLVEKGWNVTALQRRTSDLTYLKQFPVSLVKGDITNYDDIKNAIPRGTDVVFHVAGSTNMWSERNAEQTAINIEGTRNMLNAALQQNVGTFIYTSSVAAWGHATGLITEQEPQLGDESWVNYQYTKWAAEQEVLKAGHQDMKVVILEPSSVSGPYDMNNWGRIVIALNKGELPGVPKGFINVTHVREVVRAHLNAVDMGNHGERYLLTGDERTFEEFIVSIANASEISDIPRTVPAPILSLMAKIEVLKSKFTGKPPRLTPEMVDLSTRTDVTYACDKAKKQLDYKIIPMEQTVRDCHAWLKRENFI